MLLQMSGFLSFSWLNNISLYMYFILSLSIYPSVDTSVVSLFWLLWIMLLWAWGVDIWDPAFTSFGYIPRREIVGSYDSFIFKFFRIFHTVFHSGIPIYIPTNCTQAFPFLHILVLFCRFANSHSINQRGKVTSHHVLFFFSVISVGVHLFIYCWPLVYIL